VLEVVKGAFANGVPLDQIIAMVPPNKWIAVDGDLTAEKFREQASTLQAKLGGTYNLRRYFCDDDQLFVTTGGHTR
jgi:hypothetical protein